MEVILLEKVANLGQLGEVVKVKPGYARNYLIPHGKARRATKENLAEFELKRAELERVEAKHMAQARERARQLEGLQLTLTQKAGVDGKLFGSVTNIDIQEALQAKGVDVPRAVIRMPHGPLKQTGDHTVSIALHSDVVVELTVSVVAET